jgi:hypothetical protein
MRHGIGDIMRLVPRMRRGASQHLRRGPRMRRSVERSGTVRR